MTRLWVGWLAVAVISGCLLIAGAAAGERHRVPGTHVTIEPPAAVGAMVPSASIIA